jgi:hypothetical protein
MEEWLAQGRKKGIKGLRELPTRTKSLSFVQVGGSN